MSQQAVVFYLKGDRRLSRDTSMTHYPNRFSLLLQQIFAFFALLGAALIFSTLGIAAGLDLYRASVRTADHSEAGQAAAFQTALKTVLVRVTGRRSAAQDPAFAPLLDNTRRYVQAFRALPDNQLSVSFDGASLERWLAQNGQPLWGRERPNTVVWLIASTPAPGTVVTIDDKSVLKDLIDEAAAARGIRLTWPSATDLSNNHLDFAAVNRMSTSALAELGRRINGDAVLVGRATNLGASASVRWIHGFQDHNSESTGATEGVNRAADTYAGTFAANGNIVPIDIEVSGVTDLRVFADLQTYLESLTFISHVSIQSLSGDTVKFRLTSRGGSEAVQHALVLSGRLQVSAPGENGMQRYQLRR